MRRLISAAIAVLLLLATPALAVPPPAPHYLGTVVPAMGTPTEVSVTVGAASAQAWIGGNYKYIMLQNTSGANFIACNWTAQTAVLNANGSFMLPPYAAMFWEASFTPSSTLTCIASAGSTPLYIEAN